MAPFSLQRLHLSGSCWNCPQFSHWGKYQTPLVRDKVLKNQASRRGLGWGGNCPAMREKDEVGVSLGQPKLALCSLPGPCETSPGPGPPPAPAEPRASRLGQSVTASSGSLSGKRQMGGGAGGSRLLLLRQVWLRTLSEPWALARLAGRPCGLLGQHANSCWRRHWRRQPLH